MKKYLVFLFILLSSNVFAQTEHLTILHFNDLHGHVEQASRIAAKIKEIKKENASDCRQTLVLNGGDLVSGTPVSGEFKGEAESKFLNAINNKALVIGNHDFDFGLYVLEQNMQSYKFPTLSANIMKKEDSSLFTKSFVVDEIKGCASVLKIGIFGLTHPDTPVITNPKNVETLKFTDPITAAKLAMKDISKNSDIQIALTHEGVKRDISLAQKVKGIDIIIGGHDHIKPNDYCEKVGRVPVCQTPPNGAYLGKIDLDIENGRVEVVNETIIPIDKKVKPDKDAEKFLKPYFSKIDKEMKEVVGKASQKFDKPKLGHLIAGVLKDYVNADFGIVNSGGIRKGLKKGKITAGDINEVLPFPNIVLKLKMKGKDIQNLLKYSKSNGDFLVLSGLYYNTQLESNKDYTVATIDFLVNGGDGCKDFKKGIILKDSETIMKDMFIEYVKREKKI